ncbi:hypothetical protein [Priestia aryabhattai]
MKTINELFNGNSKKGSKFENEEVSNLYTSEQDSLIENENHSLLDLSKLIASGELYIGPPLLFPTVPLKSYLR